MNLERKGAATIVLFIGFLLMALSEDASALVHIVGFVGYIVSFIYGMKVFKEYEQLHPDDIN